ncbi:MAG TPA: hypothetical protein VF383_15510 [Candidatus Dormibacteraeota bacterium]
MNQPIGQTASDTCGICGEPAAADFTYRLNPDAELASDPSRVNVISLCKDHDEERRASGDQAFFDKHVAQ